MEMNRIEEMLEEAMIVRYGVGDELDGYYTQPNMDTELGRIIASARKIGMKKLLGSINQSDYENIYAQALEYVLEAMITYEHGDMKKHILTHVHNRFRELSKTGYNSDYNYNKTTRTYQSNNIIKADPSEIFETIEDTTNQERYSGDLTTYIFETYINEDYLTKKQYQFLQDYMFFDVDRNGCIYNDEGELMYRKDTVCKLKKNIKKRLEKAIAEDPHIDMSSTGRLVYRY